MVTNRDSHESEFTKQQLLQDAGDELGVVLRNGETVRRVFLQELYKLYKDLLHLSSTTYVAITTGQGTLVWHLEHSPQQDPPITVRVQKHNKTPQELFSVLPNTAYGMIAENSAPPLSNTFITYDDLRALLSICDNGFLQKTCMYLPQQEAQLLLFLSNEVESGNPAISGNEVDSVWLRRNQNENRQAENSQKQMSYSFLNVSSCELDIYETVTCADNDSRSENIESENYSAVLPKTISLCPQPTCKIFIEELLHWYQEISVIHARNLMVVFEDPPMDVLMDCWQTFVNIVIERNKASLFTAVEINGSAHVWLPLLHEELLDLDLADMKIDLIQCKMTFKKKHLIPLITELAEEEKFGEIILTLQEPKAEEFVDTSLCSESCTWINCTNVTIRQLNDLQACADDVGIKISINP